jgi:hypothetical protein
MAGDDPGAKTLSQITAGVHSEIATGTQFEMQQKEDELMRQWSSEGFKEEQGLESWGRTLMLLTAMGYHHLFDPKLVNVERLDLTGRVPLTQWSGRTAKGGGEYEYAFDGMKITAQPKLPSNTSLNYKTTAELPKALLEISRLRESLGPTLTFLLAD